jgi:hypothetical protein
MGPWLLECRWGIEVSIAVSVAVGPHAAGHSGEVTEVDKGVRRVLGIGAADVEDAALQPRISSVAPRGLGLSVDAMAAL